jgi:hypothetical protein
MYIQSLRVKHVTLHKQFAAINLNVVSSTVLIFQRKPVKIKAKKQNALKSHMWDIH